MIYALPGPFVGEDQSVDASFLEPNQAEVALNCILDDGTIRKRGGWISRALFTDTGDGPITGVFDYVKNSGARITLVKSGSNLYAVTVTGTSWTYTKLNSSFSLSASALCDFAAVNDRVYFCDGTTIKVTDGTDVYDVAIARPDDFPVVVTDGAVGAGVLSGEYYYVYTYYASLWGQESQSSDGSIAIVPNGQNVQITMTNSTDPRMGVGGKLRVYRRKVSAGEQFFYLVREVDQGGGASTVFVDAFLDNDVTLGAVAPPIEAAVPQDTSMMALQGGILFLGGSTQFPQRIYYTRANQPYTIMGSISVGTEGDAERVTGLAAYRSVLVVFKENSIWVLSGDSKETFFAQKVIPDIGCRSHHSIVFAEGLLFFLSHNGIYAFDGAETVRISDPVKKRLDARLKDLDTFSVGALFRDLGMILWIYAGPGASSPDSAIAYFYRNSQRVQKRSWSPWLFQEAQPSYLAITRDALTGVQVPVFAFNSGDIGTYADVVGGDNGQPIKFTWRTGKIAFDRNDKIKLWRSMSFQCLPTDEGQTIDFHVLRNDVDTGVLLHTQDMSDPNVRRRLGVRARQLRLELFNHNLAPVEVVWLSLEGEVLGRQA